MWIKILDGYNFQLLFNSIEQIPHSHESIHTLEEFVVPKDLDIVKDHYNHVDTNLSEISFSLRIDGQILSAWCSSKKIGDHTESTWTLKSERDKKALNILMTAAHDLRSPVNSILGLTNVLKMMLKSNVTLDSKELGKMVNMIALSCNQAIDFTNDLLELSTMEIGQYKLDTEEVKLAPFLKNYIATHRLLALKKKIKVQFVNELENGSAYVDLDKSKITRAIDNIFTNAIKFSEVGAQILIKLTIIKSRLSIVIKDEGIGIPPDVIEHLFVKFGKSQRPGLKGEKSHGLGLSIVKEIMELHGGDVFIKSKEGQGTEVCLVFERKMQEL